MRILLSITLQAVLLLPSISSAMSPLPVDVGFSDVSFYHPNAEAVAYMKSQRIVEGYSDGTFKPNQTINRAEFTKIVVNAFAGTNVDTANCNQVLGYFTDVDTNAWYSSYLCFAGRNNIIEGYADKTFRPDQTINFAEAAKIIAETDIRNFEGNTTQSLPPVEYSSPWYEAPIKHLEENYAIPLTIDTFDQAITRGEMAEIIWRLQTGTQRRTSTYEMMELVHTGDYFEYNLMYDYEFYANSKNPYDGRVIRTNTLTENTRVIIQSIKDALPILQESMNLTLNLLPNHTSDTLYFKTALKDTDNSGGKIYSFNVNTLNFVALAINDVYSGFYDGTALSQDRERFVWIFQPENENASVGFVQTMYLGNNRDYSYRLLVRLTGNETFNGGGYAFTSEYDIEWIDEHTIRFAVFDQSKKERGLMHEEALVEYRTVRIE